MEYLLFVHSDAAVKVSSHHITHIKLRIGGKELCIGGDTVEKQQ
jgi:hypothetical protein